MDEQQPNSRLDYFNTDEYRRQILNRNLGYSYYKSMPIPNEKTPSNTLQHTNNNFSVIDLDDISIIENGLRFYTPEIDQTYDKLITTLPNYGDNVNEGGIYEPGAYQFETPTNIYSVLTGTPSRMSDTPMAKKSVDFLSNAIYSNIGENLSNLTVDRLSFDAENLLLGTEPIFSRDYQITVPGTPITRAAEYISRISGVQSPTSYIPGEFFTDGVRKGKIEGFVDRARETVGDILNLDFRSIKERKTYNQRLLQYTSRGQKSVYYKNLNYNKYRPDHEKKENGGILQRVGERVENFLGIGAPDENTYISLNFLESIESKGKFVSGQSIISKEFENGGVTPNFTWKGDSETFESFLTTDTSKFSNNTIIKKTKEILNEFDQIQNEQDKLSHPGAVISNLSKKFYDGNKIISKGNATKNEDGEFCRVWTKDFGYDRYGRLMRFEGMTTSQRRFRSSILSSTANLNIGPTRDDEGNALNFNESPTKYMFSIENLAWKDSDELNERPICEIGENGGRIMWFPPYDLKFSDDNTANWTTHNILGRPEPIYTYQNAERTGSLSFKVVVDHPTIFNKIREKKINEINEQNLSDDLINEFVNGCRSYDLYELSSELTFLSLNETLTLNNLINDFGKEGLSFTTKKFNIPNSDGQNIVLPDNKTLFENLYGDDNISVRLFWFNDIPGPSISETTTNNYGDDFDDFLSKKNEYRQYNQTLGSWTRESLNKFFDETLPETKASLDGIIQTIKKTLEKNDIQFNITINASASSPGSRDYNLRLSKRRLYSVKNYVLSKIGNKYQDKLKVSENPVGEDTNVVIDGTTYNCSENLQTGDERIYGKIATFCRNGVIKFNIDKTSIVRPEAPPVITKENEEEQKINYDGEGAKTDLLNLIIKSMSSECDYFTEINENTPTVFSSLEEKLKYFHPTFHSTTPEGLNSRLTFLQQCLRPGNTLKVIGVDNEEQNNISSNTSFGKPPVCVLRIGDFYHSKIIVESTQISFDEGGFDLNPEGIGVQPMLATVTMRIKYIGGQSLEGAVNELQNALSFNYYANTEVYEPKLVKEKVNEGKLKKLSNIQNSLKDRLQQKFNDEMSEVESNLKDDFWGNIIDDNLISYTETYNKFKNALYNYIISVDNLITDTNTSPFFWYGLVEFKEIKNNRFKYLDFKSKPLVSQIESYRGDVVNTIGSTNDVYFFLNGTNHNDVESFVFDDYANELIDNQINGSMLTSRLIDEIKNNLKEIRKLIDQMNIIIYDGIDGYNDNGNINVIQLTQRPEFSADLKILYESDIDRFNNHMNILEIYIKDYYKTSVVSREDEIRKRLLPNLLNDEIMSKLIEERLEQYGVQGGVRNQKIKRKYKFVDFNREVEQYGINKQYFKDGVNFDGNIVYFFEEVNDESKKNIIRKYEKRWV